MRLPARHALPVVAVAFLSLAGMSSPAEAGWHGRHEYSTLSFGFGWAEPEPIYEQPLYPAYYDMPVEPIYDQQGYYNPPEAVESRYCREYNSTSYVAGRPQSTYGTACMQPDGSWEIQDKNQ